MTENTASKEKTWDALIVGAGISGLTARRVLSDAGLEVITLEKSRGLGGRMATRRWSTPQGESLADLGAQFVSVKGEAFKRFLQSEQPSFLREVFIPGLSHPRTIHSSGMSALAKISLSKEGPILKQVRATSVTLNSEKIWEVSCDDNRFFRARAVFLSAPLPQSLELIKRSELPDEEWILAALAPCSYSPCLAALFPLEVDLKIPPPGILKNVSETIEGIFDQQKKGVVSASPSIVVHASAKASRLLWDQPESEILSELWNETLRILSSRQGQNQAQPQAQAMTFQLPSSASLHKWRYCEPESPLALPYYAADHGLFFVGDAFAGLSGGRSRVEGAFESGREAAVALTDRLRETTRQGASSANVKRAWLSEIQAIAIYEAECFLLRKSAITEARRLTLKVCEEILEEEREHSDSLLHGLSARDVRGASAMISRWGGYALGCVLSALPASLSWRAHSWAEKEAAEIYRDARERILQENNGSADEPLLLALERAMQQEVGHAVRFQSLLHDTKKGEV